MVLRLLDTVTVGLGRLVMGRVVLRFRHDYLEKPEGGIRSGIWVKRGKSGWGEPNRSGYQWWDDSKYPRNDTYAIGR